MTLVLFHPPAFAVTEDPVLKCELMSSLAGIIFGFCMVQPDSGVYPTWLAEVQQMLDAWQSVFQQRGVTLSLQITKYAQRSLSCSILAASQLGADMKAQCQRLHAEAEVVCTRARLVCSAAPVMLHALFDRLEI